METEAAAVSDQTIAPRNPAGRKGKESDDEKKDVSRLSYGNSSEYRISRLKRDHPDAAKRVEGKSTRQIAEEVGCDHKTVINVRKRTGENSPVDLPTEIIGKDGKQAREAALAVSENPKRGNPTGANQHGKGKGKDVSNSPSQRDRASANGITVQHQRKLDRISRESPELLSQVQAGMGPLDCDLLPESALFLHHGQ